MRLSVPAEKGGSDPYRLLVTRPKVGGGELGMKRQRQEPAILK